MYPNAAMLAVVLLGNLMLLLPSVWAQNGKEAPCEPRALAANIIIDVGRKSSTRLCVRTTVCSGLLQLLLLFGVVVVGRLEVRSTAVKRLLLVVCCTSDGGVTEHSRRVVCVTLVQGYLLSTKYASVGGIIWQRWEVTNYKYFVTVIE